MNTDELLMAIFALAAAGAFAVFVWITLNN